MSSAARQRLYKQRCGNGRAILRLEVDVGDVADMLVVNGFLQQWDAEDRDAIARGLERVIAVLCQAGDASPE